MRLQNKTALVTGGSHGIGQAIAFAFAREGARVAVCGNEPAALEETAAGIRAEGGEAAALAADVRDSSQVDAMMQRLVDEYGEPDIVVNSAGICEVAPFLELTEEQWDRHLAVNLKGAFLVSQRAARLMAAAGKGGSIIQVSSVNGLAAEARQAHYNTSKGGLNSLMMSMALELAPLGIRVNSLCPGFIETRLTRPLIDNPAAIADYLKTIPMGRVGRPDEMADAAVFLASADSRYMTGHCLVVDGGQLIKLS
ncbi:3-oxoacyl-ACP reductase [Paenibacillus sp. J31TS4]|uniref:SDR family NAD(P)-dependent oxidoreductase n=1 Tax=Paenibacillus sp. J31TS4 TaxID=2807195 RepID=UPI001AFE18D6|nr:SDR family NAD(P)-dependent oxidoreductase [Paenibacillus sp. J31TS4]GIP37228.1 3-oxoacyl-ACP reductase [Paenibacillus sp. J31TS4]